MPGNSVGGAIAGHEHGDMRVRQAKADDATAIAVVHVRSWQAAYQGLMPQDFLDGLTPDQRQAGWERRLTEAAWPRTGTLVAEVDNHVVGFAHFGPTRDNDENPTTTGEITSIYLVPEVWGRGVGTRLITTSLDTLACAGYEQASLWVLDSNIRAQRFYQRHGFSCDGAVKQDATRGFVLTEVRYRRTLT